MIRTGVVLCRGVDDILEELHGVSTMYQVRLAGLYRWTPLRETNRHLGPLLRDRHLAWMRRSGRSGMRLPMASRSIDELVQNLEFPVSTLSPVLLMLEMKKVLRRLPGNRYERL